MDTADLAAAGGLADAVFKLLGQPLDGADGLACAGVTIPDTIVYRGRVACGWYKSPPVPPFSGSSGSATGLGAPGGVVRSFGSLSDAAVEAAFLGGRSSGLDIVAVYVCAAENNDGKTLKTRAPPSVEYLDADGLHNFLSVRRKGLRAILQRFVPPRGTQNSVIRILWTPRVTNIEACVSRSPLFAIDTPAAARCATWEAPEETVDTVPAGGAITPAAVRKACEAMADHIAVVTHHEARVAALSAFFKLAADGRITLLWVSSVKLETMDSRERLGALKARIAESEEVIEAAHRARLVVGSLAEQLGFRGEGVAPKAAGALSGLDARGGLIVSRAAPGAAEVATTRRINADIDASMLPEDVLALVVKAGARAGDGRSAAKASPSAVAAATAAGPVHVRGYLFDAETQCPSCGGCLSEGRTGVVSGDLVVSFATIAGHWRAVCAALGRQPFFDSVQSAAWNVAQIDLEAAEAMVAPPESFFPPAKVVFAVTGGVGIFTSGLDHPPFINDVPSPADLKRPDLKGAPLFGPHRTAQYVNIRKTRYERDADWDNAAAERQAEYLRTVEQRREQHNTKYLELARKDKIPVPEIPPTISVVLPALRPREYRAIKTEPNFSGKSARVCERCYLTFAAAASAVIIGRDPTLALRETLSSHESRMVSVRRAENARKELETARADVALATSRREAAARHQSAMAAARETSTGSKRHTSAAISPGAGSPLTAARSLRNKITFSPALDAAAGSESLEALRHRAHSFHSAVFRDALRAASFGGSDHSSSLARMDEPPQMSPADAKEWLARSLATSSNLVSSPVLMTVAPALYAPDYTGRNSLLTSIPSPSPVKMHPETDGLDLIATRPLSASVTAFQVSRPESRPGSSPSSASPKVAKPRLGSRGREGSRPSTGLTPPSSRGSSRRRRQRDESPSPAPTASGVLNDIIKRVDALADSIPSSPRSPTRGDAAALPISAAAESEDAEETKRKSPIIIPPAPAFFDDVVGDFNFDGFSTPSRESGVLAVARVAIGARRYMGLVRRAATEEIRGMVWTDIPDGADLTPYAVTLASYRSLRVQTCFVRRFELKLSINRLVRAALVREEIEGAAELSGAASSVVLPESIDLSRFLAASGVFSSGARAPKSFDETAIRLFPRTTTALPPGSLRSTPSACQLAVMLAMMPECAADEGAATGAAVPPCVSLNAARIPTIVAPKLPPSGRGTRAVFCAYALSLFESIRQPLFLLRRFNPETGSVSCESFTGQADDESWISFARLAWPRRRVPPALLYAAKCRYAALAGHGGLTGGQSYFRLSPLQPGSESLAGSIARLIPGHWLAGNHSLDRARGFIGEDAAVALNSISAAQLYEQEKRSNAAQDAFEARLEKANQLAIGLGIPLPKQGLRPSRAHLEPRKIAPRDRNDLRPIDVKETLEHASSSKAAYYETTYWKEAGGEMLLPGALGRRLLQRPDGYALHCSMSVGFPDEAGGGDDLRTGKGAINTERFIAVSIGSTAKAMYRIRVYSSATGVVTSRWLSLDEVRRPLTDYKAFDLGLDPDAEFPGNPFLDIDAFIACADVPVATREVPIATRFIAADKVQRFIGLNDAGTASLASVSGVGTHPSIPLGGVYHISLWARPEALKGKEEPREQGGDGVAAWDWSSGDEGTPIAAAIRATLTAAQSDAELGRKTNNFVYHPPARLGLPRFTVRAQYLRQPCPVWDSPEIHDARIGSLEGVRKGARLVSAEMAHWVASGNMPSSARLPHMAVHEKVFTSAFPHIRQQASHAGQPWSEPVYAFKAALSDLAQTGLNPFIELLPKGAIA